MIQHRECKTNTIYANGVAVTFYMNRVNVLKRVCSRGHVSRLRFAAAFIFLKSWQKAQRQREKTQSSIYKASKTCYNDS